MKRIVKRFLCLALCGLMLLGAAMAEENAPAGVLAVINGVTYPVDDVQSEFDYYAAMYESYGLADEIEELRDDIIEFYVQYYAQIEAARQLGLADFTEEEKADITAEAQAEYDELLASYTDYFAEEGMSDEDIADAVRAYFDENGYTLEVAEKTVLNSRIMNRYYESVTAEAQVTDEDVAAVYGEKVAAQKDEFESDPWSFEYSAMYGDDIYYVPEGFRAVYHILLLLEEGEADALADLTARKEEIGAQLKDATGEDAKALQAELNGIDEQINGLCAPLLERADEIYARLDAGEDFMALMDEYGEDPGMQSEPTRSKGYYVSATSEMWEKNFRDGAMALEKEGDVSEPVLTSYGIHLILHGGELAAGPVPLETVRDGLMDETLAEARQAAYDAAVAALMDTMDITVYPENVVYRPTVDDEDAVG